MKKGHQIISIVGLCLATIVLLIVIYVRHYEDKEAFLFTMLEHLEQEFVANEDEKAKEEENIETVETQQVVVEETAPAPLEFVASDVSYFDDALFIGDSRMVGIAEYGTLDNAVFFAMVGMSIHNLWDTEVEVDTFGKTNLQGLLDAQSFSKVYIMLGFNEIGYDKDYSAGKYKETIDYIHQQEPDAVIYICSNLHVTEALSLTDERYSNDNIRLYNEKIKQLADHETFFYLDVNERFLDEKGNLGAEYTGDDVHLYAKYYKEWSEWFCQNTIQK